MDGEDKPGLQTTNVKNYNRSFSEEVNTEGEIILTTLCFFFGYKTWMLSAILRFLGNVAFGPFFNDTFMFVVD